MYDDVYVRRVAADENAASNGLVSNAVSVRVHKVSIVGALSNATSVNIHDDTNASNALLIKAQLSTSPAFAGTFELYAEATFGPPIAFNTGISLDLTGTGAVVYLYYTR